MTKRTITLVALSLELFCTLGCTDPEDQHGIGSYDGPKNECESSDDCPAGATCDPEQFQCVVSKDVAQTEYYIRVIVDPDKENPNPDTTVPPQVFKANLDGSGNTTETVVIRRPVSFGLEFSWSTESETAVFEAIEGRVYFTNIGMLIPGRPALTTAYKIIDDEIEVELLPGVYRITVIPDEQQKDKFPTLYFDDVELTEDAELYLAGHPGPLETIEIPWFDPEQNPTLVFNGQIKRGSQPVDGLTVQALDPQTGRLVSTLSQTTCTSQTGLQTCGSFTIGLTPDAVLQRAFTLLVTRPQEPQYPVVRVPNLTTEDDGIVIELKALGVPVRLLAKVEGTAASEIAPKCNVVFESEDFETETDATGIVEHVVTTNESGGLEKKEGEPGVDLYPQIYKVTVIPLEASPGSNRDYTAKLETIDLLNTSDIDVEGTVFSLVERPQFGGRVLVAGKGVPNTTIVAERSADAPVHVRDSTATTDPNGWFAIWMDQGSYRVTAEVPPESGYAWGTTDVEVLSDDQFDIELRLPFVARANLVSEKSGTEEEIALEGAVVEWYEVVAGRGYVVSRATADAAGRVRALLPP